MIGTWVLYIPRVKEKLQLDDSEIGLALFSLALGLLFFIPLVPFVTKKIGLGKCTFFGICAFSIVFIGPFIATNYVMLCVSLFVVGVFSALTDIAMNTLVSEIEKKDGVNIMSAAHGFFSLGGAVGALIGTLLISLFDAPLYHVLFMIFLVVAINWILSKQYFNITEKRELKNKSKLPLKVFKPLFALAFLALVVMSSEGAIEHWSSIYLIEIVEVSSRNLAGLGFTTFSIMMTIGRFFGDRISEKIGSTKIIILGCVLACIGYICVLLSQVLLSVIGFGVIGLGLSVVIPELLRVAGNTKGISTSKSISFVSGIGFIGFLIGPVILGYISASFSLKMSFLFLFVLTLFALVLTILRPRFN
jgi:MFS family permease